MKPYIPDTLPFSGIDFQRLYKRSAKANTELARFDGLLQSMSNAEMLLAPLTTNEAVLSSRIEGTQATLDDVLEYEAGAKKPEALVRDIREIINYRQAMYYSRKELLSRPISLGFLRELHQILMDDVRGDEKTPGNFRQTQNFIGKPNDTLKTATFVPPDPVRLVSDLEDFQRYLEFDDEEELLQTAIVHAQFELIHPFNDGNGRIGRLLIPLFLYQKKKLSKPVFYISGYLEKHRETYYARLRGISSPEKDWNGWIEFFLDAVAEEASNNCEKAKKMLELYEEMKTIIYNLTRSHNTFLIQDALFNHPIFQSHDFVQATGLKPDTARNVLSLLKKAGIVREIEPARGRIPARLVFAKLVNISGTRSRHFVLPSGIYWHQTRRRQSMKYRI